MIFCDPFTLRILNDQPDAPALFAVGQRLCWHGPTMWHLVTPGLLQWMSNVIEQQLAKGAEIETSVVFYHRLIELAGLKLNGSPERPEQFDVMDHREAMAGHPMKVIPRRKQLSRAALAEI